MFFKYQNALVSVLKLLENSEIVTVKCSVFHLLPDSNYQRLFQNDLSRRLLGVRRNPCRFGVFSEGSFFVPIFIKQFSFRKKLSTIEIFSFRVEMQSSSRGLHFCLGQLTKWKRTCLCLDKTILFTILQKLKTLAKC